MKISTMLSAVVLSSGLLLSFSSFAGGEPDPKAPICKTPICTSHAFKEYCDKQASKSDDCLDCQKCEMPAPAKN